VQIADVDAEVAEIIVSLARRTGEGGGKPGEGKSAVRLV
jgi:hypothetical protein